MDSIGNLELAWAQSYDGSKAEFINRDTVCYRCGNNIKFIGEDGHENVYPSGGEGLGPIAVHKINKVFAVAEVGIEPKINIFQYPSFKHVRELTDGAKLEYIYMEFSHSEYLATISGIPEYKLTIWNYVTGKQLCEHELNHELPTNVSFNPANWRELCITYDKELTFWKIDQCDEEYYIQKNKLKLPSEDATLNYVDNSRDMEMPTRASTRMSKVSVKLPISSIAGVQGEDADRFQEYQEAKTRVRPIAVCWLTSGDVLIGCRGGQLLKIDGENFKIKVLYNPGPRPSNAVSRTTSANVAARAIPEEEMDNPQLIAEPSESEFLPPIAAEDSATSLDFTAMMTEGSVNCLALHKHGLYAAGLDGTVRRLEMGQEHVRVVDAHVLGTPITSFAFNAMHQKMVIGSSRGSMFISDPTDLSKTKQLFDIHHGEFVAIDTLFPGTDHCLTIRADGELQVWAVDTSKLVSSYTVGFQATCLASSPIHQMAAVGTVNGDVFFVDLTKLEDPRLLHRIRLHEGPVRHIKFNRNGHFFLSGSDDGHIFVMDGRASSKFQPLGHIAMPGEIQGIATFLSDKTRNTKVVVTSNATEAKKLGANKIMHFSLPDDLSKDIEIKHQTLKWDLKDSVISRLNFNLANPSCGVALGDPNMAFVLSQNTKQVHKINLPNEPPKKEMSKDSYLNPVAEAPGHQLPGGTVIMSPHYKWLGSVGTDGKLCVRAVGALDRPAEVNAHDFRTGGVISLMFTADTHNIITIGKDGSLVCYRWNFHTSYQGKAKSAKQHVRDHQLAIAGESEAENSAMTAMSEWKPGGVSRSHTSVPDVKSQKEKQIEDAIESDEIFTTPTPIPGKGATWLQEKELEAHKKEDLQYKDVKTDLRTKIRDMRRELQTMMKENEEVPDIEKLTHHDFDLDVEEQQRLQAEGEAEVKRIREEKELENLAKMYLADLIKKECWDQMEVKGRGLTAFNSDTEVHNYPMKARTLDELTKLGAVKARRRNEIAELVQRKEIAEIHSKSGPSKAKTKANTVATPVDDDENGDDDEGKEKPSTTGSLGPAKKTAPYTDVTGILDPGAQYGGQSDLFYSQFELHTREEKMNQIVLLEDANYRIKKEFNRHFDDVYTKKSSEINKVKEKNKRIRKILTDLNLPVEINEPDMGVLEKPELLLVVKDEEVKVEKFLTPEQRKQKEEEEKLEAERRAREGKDNWRDRGLDMMMGGVLEIKKEDELKKDVPKPAFMTTKKEEDWSDEEKKLVAEYEKKVKDLNEEREKYKKQLEMELKKLQGLIQDTLDNFDESLKELFMRKIKTEMVIYQEELKIVSMKYSLMQEEELENREVELIDLLAHKKQLKLDSHETVIEAKKQVDLFRDLYENLQAEDKVMDKEFKRRFNDIAAWQQDQLYKLFRRRPRGQRARGAETPIYDPSSGNPFAERPSTARQKDLAKKSLDTAMHDLDNPKNCPENVEEDVWMRLCNYRHQKIESENMVKDKALVLAEMQDFLKKRQEEDDQLAQDIEDLQDALNKLREDKIRFTINLQVQLLLKQGQVEVDQGQFIPDYTDSLLIHRHVVEDLNSKIRQLGEGKIASMMESKDFRKGIVQLEWEHQKMTMEMEDLQNKMRDIQMMKVTREIQGFLNEENHEVKIQNEIAVLEQTLQLLKQHHEKNVEERKRILRELRKNIRERESENNALASNLEELNVSVNERRNIHEVNADKRSDAGRDQRYREIVQRRKLVDLAKAQAQEVAVLRAEVERLRMRTFPALVQVEH